MIFRLDLRIHPHLIAYGLFVLFSMSRSLRKEGNMQIRGGIGKSLYEEILHVLELQIETKVGLIVQLVGHSAGIRV